MSETGEVARTPRQRARVQTLRRIHELAWQQLSSQSAGELSLRAIARELGIVSSAIYRYYGSRDDLITALIIEAYDDLASHLETADADSRRGARRRWLEIAGALRVWSLDHPHRFALVYGTAIPGYRAPQDTVWPATRVLRAFAAPVIARHAEPGGPDRSSHSPVRRELRPGLAAFRQAIGDSDDEVLLALTAAFARVIGTLTLELGGHFVGSFEPADALYDVLLQREADALNL